ncbi:Pectinesterase [Quillaja saponaria]|uniref:Pectinesterase n=1 Tax=Quillaja saponaria TaxID=32244 RepID=A0AAD7QFE3_QUISA|nr:Pectinesterase [Quillaja saponaria]
MNKKIAIGVVSIILVVGVVIGLIIGGVGHKSSSDNEKELSKSSKAVAAICNQTDYKQACVHSLAKVASNQSATPKDFMQAAIQATIEQVKSAMDKSANIGKNADNSTQKMVMEDCEDLLQFAVDELQASFSMVGDSEMHTMKEREAELINWLSAVISYQQTCLDGVTSPKLKDEMSNGVLNATMLTSNALAIVSAVSEILIAFNISTNSSAGSRRLLYTSEDYKYPSWLSRADRRLLQASPTNLKPNAVVAQDGSGKYKTITAALAAYPKDLKGRYIIYVKAGVYDEYITVDKKQINVFMYGDGPRKTIVTGRKNNVDGVSTYLSATFAAVGLGFIGKSMGFQNTAGPQKHQAVALRVQSDMAAFYNCRMDGYQDTLYTQAHRQFYRNCVISGTVDFIFGDAAALIQNSLIITRKPMDGQKNTITAQGRTDKRENTAIVIQNCRLVPEQLLFPLRFQIQSYLGRPWKQFARTIIMESEIGDFIQPAGWLEWQGTFALETLYYAEYANRGPGAATDKRVKWKGYKVITDRNEALQYTAGPLIQGNQWLSQTGARYFLGFKH